MIFCLIGKLNAWKRSCKARSGQRLKSRKDESGLNERAKSMDFFRKVTTETMKKSL